MFLLLEDQLLMAQTFIPNGNMEYSSDSKDSDITVVTGDNAYKLEVDNQPVLLT